MRTLPGLHHLPHPLEQVAPQPLGRPFFAPPQPTATLELQAAAEAEEIGRAQGPIGAGGGLRPVLSVELLS